MPPASVQRHQTVKLLLLGGLALLLQLPVLLIAGLVHERRATRAKAAQEIQRTWGREQRVTGPILRVPYLHRWVEEDRDGLRRHHEVTRHALFLPESLVVSGTVESEMRQRGIFDVPVYEAHLRIGGHFAEPALRRLGINPDDALWDLAELSLRVSDPHAITAGVKLKWNDGSLPFAPGASAQDPQGGIHVPLGRTSAADFSLDLTLRGSDSLLFAPVGKETAVQLRSDWASPSFVGAWLPVERSVASSGFDAQWRVSYLSRGFPESWLEDGAGTSATTAEKAMEGAAFGTRFLSTVDEYRMAERSAKYAILFIALTFAVFWLFEILAGLPTHPVQYLLIGAALCLFYLLELALSEHLGFGAAFAAATSAVVGLVSAYTAAVLRDFARAALVAVLLIALYAFLFVLLRAEDYALLLGSLGLFAVLAAVMYLTRRIDWYGRTAKREAVV